MSPKLPVITSREVVRVAVRLGFAFDHQTGSHATYYRESDRRRVTIPMHAGKDIRSKTLASIVDDMGITPEEFQELLRS
ncbi:MAG: addiction module toxin, HicA family [Dehalococcoidia bacterium]|nr:addiction module toxin, HicA family [Dehalococcoidia bacterium]